MYQDVPSDQPDTYQFGWNVVFTDEDSSVFQSVDIGGILDLCEIVYLTCDITSPKIVFNC